MRITNFIHLSQTSDTTALTTAFGTARVHNLADKAPMQSAKWWVGILDSLNLHVHAIAGGCTKLTARVTSDAAGNESILPDTEATIATGIGTATTGSVAFSAGVALSPGWDAEFFDLTDLDVATLTNGATTGVTGAAPPFCDVKVVNYNSNNGVVSAGAAGITVAGGSAAGSLSIGFDLEAIFGITVPDDVLNDCAITLHLDGLADWTGGTDGWEAGIMADNSANFSTGTGFSVRGDFDAVGQDRVVSTNNSTSNWALNEAVPAGAWVATILLRGGQIAEAFYATGSTAPTGAALDAGGQVMARTIAAGSARWAASTFYASVRAIWRPNFVLTGVTLHTRRTA
jgi:hypothetical protein